ncbi:hypothetical protein GGR53DRAFT_463490 [Hypoxylon sp. FL1150]|nr:hypothetical protein GGR53DRAFT_463490 [Hypoxylon sp. FL1150]
MATKDVPDSPTKSPEWSWYPRPGPLEANWTEPNLGPAPAEAHGNGSGNGSASAKAESAQAQAQSQVQAAAETAVDDTEDLFDDKAVEEKRKNLGYTSRRRNSNSRRSGRHAEFHQFSTVEAVLHFGFHPHIRPLNISDLDSCVALENAAFVNPEHRCTREKFEYRLTTCPELCLGLFCTIEPSDVDDMDIELVTLPTAHPVQTGRKAKSVLLAHIVATRSKDLVVTDNAMDYPRDFRTRKGRNDTDLGHQPDGETICMHSVAVHPGLQGCGLGKLIIKAYLQQQKGAAAAERCALICKHYLIPYYERFSFTLYGSSKATFGGDVWYDMVIRVQNIPSASRSSR